MNQNITFMIPVYFYDSDNEKKHNVSCTTYMYNIVLMRAMPARLAQQVDHWISYPRVTVSTPRLDKNFSVTMSNGNSSLDEHVG